MIMQARILSMAVAAAWLATEAAMAAVVPIGRPNGGKPYMKPAVCINHRCRYDVGSVAVGEELRFRLLMAEEISYRRRMVETGWDGEPYVSIFASQWTVYGDPYEEHQIVPASGSLGPAEEMARLADLSVTAMNRSVWLDERGPGARRGVKKSGMLFDIAFTPSDLWRVGDILKIVLEVEFEEQDFEYSPEGFWDSWGYSDSLDYRAVATVRIGEAVQPVPTPAGAALMLSGLAALAAVRRRRAAAGLARQGSSSASPGPRQRLSIARA
jgi:hypothetical protein